VPATGLAGGDAAGSRASYTSEEWQTLQFAPLWAFTAVAGVDEDVDKQEMAALSKELAEASLFKCPLIREVLEAIVADLESILNDYGDDPRTVTAGLGEVADLLDLRSDPDEAMHFKRAVLLIAHNVAQASGDSPPGEDNVSDEEKAAIVLVAIAMRLKP